MPSQSLTDAVDGPPAEAPPEQGASGVAARSFSGIIDMLNDQDQRAGLAAALGSDADAERFHRILITAIKKNPQLIELGATPDGRRSIVTAIMRCAELGLEPNTDLGEAYLTTFRAKAGQRDEHIELQLLIGYKGYLKLAGQTGQMASIDVHEVYTKDHFTVRYGTGPDAGIVHEPLLMNPDGTPLKKGDRGIVYAYYGIVKFLDGGYYFTHMTLDEIDAHREASPTGDKAWSPWQTNPIPMAKKTVVRVMAPYLRLGTKAAEAVELDEKVVHGDQFDFVETTAVERPDDDYTAADAEADGDQG